MKLLEDKILKDGKVFDGDVLKVDSFLNHQIDVALICELGKEIYSMYKDCGVTKILTIEASGIGVACLTAQYFDVPVVFAKKSQTINISADVYTSSVYSYTHQREYNVVVSKQFLNENDKVLIIDDFLANGSALQALVSLVNSANAETVGAAIAIEKVYQGGGNLLREKGIRVESLAKVKAMTVEGGIEFED